MKDVMYITLSAALAVMFMVTVFFAVIGIVFIYNVDAAPVETDTCDKIQRIDSTLYCMAIMQAEDDSVQVIRSSNNFNPQETVDGSNL